MKVIHKPIFRSAILNAKRELLLIDKYGGNDEHYNPYRDYGRHVSEIPYANELTQEQLSVIDNYILESKVQFVKLNGVLTLNTGKTYYREIDRRAVIDTTGEVVAFRFSSKFAPDAPTLPIFFRHDAVEEYARQIGLSLSQLKVLMYQVYFPKMRTEAIAKHAGIGVNSVYRYSSLIKEILDIPGFTGSYAVQLLDKLGIFKIFADYLTSCYVRKQDHILLQDSEKLNMSLKQLIRDLDK